MADTVAESMRLQMKVGGIKGKYVRKNEKMQNTSKSLCNLNFVQWESSKTETNGGTWIMCGFILL